jgi:hypothetical protein
MTNVTGIVKQDDLYDMTTPTFDNIFGKTVMDCKLSPDSVSKCPTGTWQYPEMAKCEPTLQQLNTGLGQTYLCSKVDPTPNVCPLLGTQTGNAKFVNPTQSYGWNSFNGCGIDGKSTNAPGSCYTNVACTYDASKFSSADIKNWITQWGEDTNYNETVMPLFCPDKLASTSADGDMCRDWVTKYNSAPQVNEMMSTFCTKVVKTCPKDPLTLKTMPTCSRMVSTSTDGELCQNWMKNNKTVSDTSINSYCGNNNTGDCGCVNRALNPNYKELKEGIIDGISKNMDDRCWYTPCTVPYQPGELIPFSIQDTTFTCPDVCQSVFDMYNKGKIDINKFNITQTINCDWNKAIPPEEGEENPPNPEEETTPAPSPSPSPTNLLKKYWYIPLIVIILIILLIVVLLLL